MYDKVSQKVFKLFAKNFMGVFEHPPPPVGRGLIDVTTLFGLFTGRS